MTIAFLKLKDKFGQFSNFYPSEFTLDGYKWRTNEHFYQANKFVPGGKTYMDIQRAITPREAKDIGNDKTGSEALRDDWESVKIGVMLRGLEAKFKQNPEMAELLLSTGEEEIVELSMKDDIWGSGPDGKGQNLLGKCLMQVREKLRREAWSK